MERPASSEKLPQVRASTLLSEDCADLSIAVDGAFDVLHSSLTTDDSSTDLDHLDSYLIRPGYIHNRRLWSNISLLGSY